MTTNLMLRLSWTVLVATMVPALGSCALVDTRGEPDSGTDGGSYGMAGPGPVDAGSVAAQPVKYVFVIAFENHDEVDIIGNTTDAPYINRTLVNRYAIASNFIDPLLLENLSEPHYVWMEAGTNSFRDHTFNSDADPSATNSTADTAHLVTQMEAAGGDLSWRAYPEGLNISTGLCPIVTSGFYAPKHNPFVFFKNVSGDPPSIDNAFCIAHHKPYDAFAGDLATEAVARYNFITPNLCNDMHGHPDCSAAAANTIKTGDNWLKAQLPPLIDFVNAHDGVIFIVFDEGNATQRLPFFAIGPGVKKHRVSAVAYNHSSLVKTIERIFGLPELPNVKTANDFSDLFERGALP